MNNKPQCPDDYTYWMEQFCISKHDAPTSTVLVILWAFLETALALFFMKKSK